MPEPDSVDRLSRRSFLRAGGAAAVVSVVGEGVAAETLPAAAGGAKPSIPGITHHPATGTVITLNVNGRPTELHVTPDQTLLLALREQLGLTGSKQVCDRGACGACTVLVDGRSVNACLMLAVDAVGCEVTTIEGLAENGTLHPVQQAFADCDACQCGYCIPGFVVRAKALLDENPRPDAQQVRQGLAGNICRCAAYVRIFQAVESVAAKGAAR